MDQLPPVVSVEITVPWERSVAVVRGYVDDPVFDDEVGAALANRLVGVGAAVPMRLYEVRTNATPAPSEDGTRRGPPPGTSSVRVREAAGGAWACLRIEGGDRDGEVIPIAGNRPRYHVGRGEWHGDSEAPANDLVISRGDRFISRRSAVLRRAGSGLEVASLDQGEFLVVIQPDGRRIRPTHARSGRVRITTGDRIELTDGERQRVVLHVERPQAPAEESTAENEPGQEGPAEEGPAEDGPGDSPS